MFLVRVVINRSSSLEKTWFSASLVRENFGFKRIKCEPLPSGFIRTVLKVQANYFDVFSDAI